MGAGHTHNTAPGNRLWLSLAIALAFSAAEATAGLWSHSLALLADAVHNFGDALALGLTVYAASVVKRPATARHTYGFHRAAILTALFNAAALVVIALFIGVEAIKRLQNPETANALIMISVAVGAVLVNGLIAFTLAADAKHSLNIRAAFVHMLGDAASASAVVVAGLATYYGHWLYADISVSFLIAGFILFSAIGIVREAAAILMESVPKEIDMALLVRAIQSVPSVGGVHDVHVWALGDGLYFMSCHVTLPPAYSLAESAQVIQNINAKLRQDFSIGHSTIQVESGGLCVSGQGGDKICDPGTHLGFSSGHTHNHDNTLGGGHDQAQLPSHD